MQPRFDTEGTIIQEISGISKLIGEKMTLDVSGHYNRPDIFKLQIDKTKGTDISVLVRKLSRQV